jgi:hypothetical protein
MKIEYQQENNLTVVEFTDGLPCSTLPRRRPFADADRLLAMLRLAILILTARNEQGLLPGIPRTRRPRIMTPIPECHNTTPAGSFGDWSGSRNRTNAPCRGSLF